MRRTILLLAGVAGIFALAAGVTGQEGAPAGDPTAGATYIGAKACKKCHIKEDKTWKKMKHASAWENLPEKYRDPAQKDEKGRACISCHVTGYGKEGGFVDAKTSEDLLGVGCEACHGPGSKHREAGQKVLDEKRAKFNEGEPKFIVTKTNNCSDCHNPHVTHEEYKQGG
ncbi:MAG: multiheme c-type cytochrome [Planctomycetota bacterium]